MVIKVSCMVFYYLAYSFVYLGFCFHRSLEPQVGPYSLSYVAFLILLAFGFFLPLLVRHFLKKYGIKTLLFSSLPSLFVMWIVYSVLCIHYYYSRTHLFDPYLQMHPPELVTHPKSKNTFRILVCGGSTTRNVELPEEDRYPNVLEDLLKKYHTHLNIEVFNGGMDWYTTKHTLINYTTNLRELQPDMVIVMHAINDLYRSFSDPDFSVKPYSRHWSHFYGPSIRGVKPQTFEQAYLARFFHPWFSQVRYQERNVSLDRYFALKDFRRYLKNLIHVLKSDDTQILLLTQPFLYKPEMTIDELSVLWFGRAFCKEKTGLLQYQYPSADSLKTAMEAFNLATKELSAQESVVLVDLAPEIEKNLQHFVDDVHYTRHGARKVAEIVAARIINERIITGRMSRSEKSRTDR